MIILVEAMSLDSDVLAANIRWETVRLAHENFRSDDTSAGKSITAIARLRTHSAGACKGGSWAWSHL
jgi:hypothetical protein